MLGSTTDVLIVGVVVLTLLFRALAGLLTIVLALAIVAFGALLVVDAHRGGNAYVQLIANVQGALTSLAVAIVGVITTFTASRSRT